MVQLSPHTAKVVPRSSHLYEDWTQQPDMDERRVKELLKIPLPGPKGGQRAYGPTPGEETDQKLEEDRRCRLAPKASSHAHPALAPAAESEEHAVSKEAEVLRPPPTPRRSRSSSSELSDVPSDP